MRENSWEPHLCDNMEGEDQVDNRDNRIPWPDIEKVGAIGYMTWCMTWCTTWYAIPYDVYMT